MKSLRTAKRLPLAVALAALVAMTTAAFAVADIITGDANSISSTIDPFATTAPGGSGSGQFGLVVQNNPAVPTGDVDGCNAGTGGSKPPVVLSISSNQPWLTVTQNEVTLTDCDKSNEVGLQNAATVNYQVSAGAPAGATAVVKATYKSGGVLNGKYSDGSFEVRTPAAPTPSDTTAPTSSASAKNADNSAYAFGDWTNQNVTVTLGGQDNTGGSGLKQIRYTTDGTAPSASVGTVYSAPFAISAEGTTTVKFVAVDNLINVESPVNSRTVRIDKTAPVVSCGSADGNWHGSDVSIACTASDGLLSGLANAGDGSFNLATSVAAGTETSNASTNSRTVTDNAGNSSTAGPISGNKVDKKAPSVSCGSADGNWHADNVSIACTASDGGSGVSPSVDGSFSLSTTVAAGSETSNASTGSKAVSDAVGNQATAGPIAGNKIDRKAPTISCDAATFQLNQSPANVTGAASDGGSGLATSATPSAAATTSSIDTRSVSLSATDNVGNQASQSCSYSVVYGLFTGFLAPIDNPSTGKMNGVKAGSAVPVKFKLADANGASVYDSVGLDLLVTGSPSTQSFTCDSSVAVDQDTPTTTAGSSSLSYDAATATYTYVWKTDKAWAGQCRSLTVTFNDGSAQSKQYINFKLLK